jgi:hydroxypyruvate isomerase
MRWAANCGTLWAELPVRERFDAAAAAGFAYAEMWSPFGDENTLARRISASALELVAFLFEPGDMQAGDRGIVNVPGRDGECLALFERSVHFAGDTGARHITVLAGNLIDDRETELDRAADVLRRAAEIVEPAGLTLAVEPLNSADTPRYLLPDALETAEWVRAIDRACVRLLLDVYHVAAEGADPVEVIPQVSDVLAHVHFADNPGRGAPGTGDLDFDAIVLALEECGYDGFVGIEYLRGESATDETLAWLPREARAVPIQPTRARTR